MKKTSLLNFAVLFAAAAFLSACAHTPKNTASDTFSFMGHKLSCGKDTTLANEKTWTQSCKNSQLNAAFFHEEEAWIEDPNEPVQWIENAIGKTYTTEKESFVCPDGNYVATIKIFKGKKKKHPGECILHIKPNGFMYICYNSKSDDFSILATEAINDLCTRKSWILPEGVWEKARYEDETEEENSSNDL